MHIVAAAGTIQHHLVFHCHAFYPPLGPYMFIIVPFCATADRNLIEFTFLCPLYITFWFSPGRQMGLTVPSINPKQFCNDAPALCILSANIEV